MASWAEQYQARKAERLKEENMKLNKKLGFGASGKCLDSNKGGFKDGNEAKLVEDEVANTVDENVGVTPSSEKNPNSTDGEATDIACNSDPWYSTYESKKAAALENLKTGKLQSVSGASGYVGKIEGVEHLSKKNEVTKLISKFRQEDNKPSIGESDEIAKEKGTDRIDTKSLPKPVLSSTKSTSGPPLPPRQLLQLSMPEEPSSPPSDRPARPSVPTPGKYGTLYGGAPSPGPNPSRSFQPPGFVPPTPPASQARRRPWLASNTGDEGVDRKEEKESSIHSIMRSVKADSKLSTTSWQEEYLARKKARLGNN